MTSWRLENRGPRTVKIEHVIKFADHTTFKIVTTLLYTSDKDNEKDIYFSVRQSWTAVTQY